MEYLVLSVATGALKPILKKLPAVLQEEYKRYKGAPDEVKSLTKELEAMDAFLLNMSEEEDLDPQDSSWMNEVRELSYDMEDSLDKFLLCVHDKSADPKGFTNKAKNLASRFWTRRDTVKVIEGLKKQVTEVGERNQRYKNPSTTTKTTGYKTVDQRALHIYKDASHLVGIKRPKEELIQFLKGGDRGFAASSQQLKAVSIVGDGGIGKSTLAEQVYKELKPLFDCGAFISVSRRPDLMNVLRLILSSVSNMPYKDTEAGDIQHIISQIIGFLQDKSYIIVIDDVWTEQAWDVIKCTLQKSSKESIVITTTRILSVAEACHSSHRAHVYKMRPLDRMDSRKLLLRMLFVSEEKCPAYLNKVSDEILEKCKDLPLAIISISGLLIKNPEREEVWNKVNKSIGRALAKNPGVEEMTRILSLSYIDLPHHLKSCLLYLSIFPEDSIIYKKCLVRRWIAEGFVEEEEEEEKEEQRGYELGEMYFNELINRNLIQAAKFNVYGEVTACRVHDIILDFITVQSVQDNFVTILTDGYQMPRQHSKVRRLSLHGSSEDTVSKLKGLALSHVRSLTAFNYSATLPSLSDFRFLRVLDLQGFRKVTTLNYLVNMKNLFQLKYLRLPNHINLFEIDYLEACRFPAGMELPGCTVQIPRLVYLVCNIFVKLPAGIGGMTTLEELECIGVFNQSIEVTGEIGQLSNLRSIGLFLCSDYWRRIGYFRSEGDVELILTNIVSSLCTLAKLHSLSIDIDTEDRSMYPKNGSDYTDHKCAEKLMCLDSAGGSAPLGLRRFHMTGGYISKVPNWIGSLTKLQLLTLHVNEFEEQDILALGRLPVLGSVRLIAHQSFHGRRVFISGLHGFPCLRSFEFRCAVPVSFGAGAMPMLQKLSLKFCPLSTDLVAPSHGDFPFGIEHLTSLQRGECFVYNTSSNQVKESWVARKKAQLAAVSCKAAMDMLVEIKATLDEMWLQPRSMEDLAAAKGPKGAFWRACLAHPNRPAWSYVVTGSWMTNPAGVSTLMLIDYSFNTLDLLIRDVRREVEERVRNCPLKGDGNCPCWTRAPISPPN
ncbi:unnamed protein product [Urochloa humidicola]